jgi:hypothetical protein
VTLSGHRCELCGRTIVPWTELRYRRVGTGSAERLLRGTQRCAHCGKAGCPQCLQLVEERVDDFFFDQPICLICLRQGRPGP